MNLKAGGNRIAGRTPGGNA